MPADLEEIYAKMLKQDADVFKIAVIGPDPGGRGPRPEAPAGGPEADRRVLHGRHRPAEPVPRAQVRRPVDLRRVQQGARHRPGLPSLDDFRTTYPGRGDRTATRASSASSATRSGTASARCCTTTIYKRLGVNALYLPFRVPRGHAAAGGRGVRRRSRSTATASPSRTRRRRRSWPARRNSNVEVTQAANTLVRLPDGKFLGGEHRLRGRGRFAQGAPGRAGRATARSRSSASSRCCCSGAGGVARAIAFALHREGAQLTITGRTYERAQRLAEEVKCKAVDWHARHSVSFDVLINCTPVGMHPNVDESPCHFSILKPGVTVFDTIYRPETTLLIREARTRGCHIITGVDMFVRQAARQIELFIGQTPTRP